MSESALEVCTGMGTAEIARNLRVSRGYGYECCGNFAGMDIIMAETPREWSVNLAVKNFGCEKFWSAYGI